MLKSKLSIFEGFQMPEFPEILKRMRLEQELSQRALSSLTGGEVSDGYISMIEQGKYVPSRKVVRILAKALKDKEGLLMTGADRDRLPPDAEVSVERAKEEIKKLRDERKQEKEIALQTLLLPAHIARVLSGGPKTDNRLVARFYVRLFLELFQEGLVDEDFYVRYDKTVQDLKDHYHPDWPRDLRRSPFEMVQELTYEKNPPQLDKAMAILDHVREVYRPMLEKITGESVKPFEMSQQKAGEVLERDRNLDGSSDPLQPLGE